MRNTDIRQQIQNSKVRHWQVADKYGVPEGSFSRLLRYELPRAEKEKIMNIIDQLKKEGSGIEG